MPACLRRPAVCVMCGGSMQGVLGTLRIGKGNKVPFPILRDVTGILKPARTPSPTQRLSMGRNGIA